MQGGIAAATSAGASSARGGTSAPRPCGAPGHRLQAGHLADGETAVADVPSCTFEVLLVDDEDIWHAEYHDCNSTDLTFTSDTGHGHR